MKHVATNLTLWSFRWIEVSLRGWGHVLLRGLRFLFGLIVAIPISMHLFVLSSLSVAAMSVLPWFYYTLDLGGQETYESTSNLWYLFLLPGASGLLFALLVRPWSYRIQLGIGSALLLLFFLGWLIPGFHSDMQSPPLPTSFFFLYPVALLTQNLLAFTLRQPAHGILNRMRARWKMKEAA